MTADVTDPQEQLAWEERIRPRAAAIALLSAVLTIIGIVILQRLSSGAPSASLLDTLTALERAGAIDDQPSARAEVFQYQKDNAGASLISRALLAIGFLGIGLTLAFLGRATLARSPRLRRWTVTLVGVAGAVVGAALLILYIGESSVSDTFLESDRTLGAVPDSSDNATIIGSTAIIFGLVAFAVAGVMICLNAMRVGLLTRVMGMIGIFATGSVIPFVLGPIQPLLPLWTLFLAPLFLGRWPGGQPPAWRTGQAEPWPSSAQMREERTKARGKLAEPDPEPVEERATGTPHPSSKKRKRKRRG